MITYLARFIENGGQAMYPILAAGLVTLASAALHAYRARPRPTVFLLGMATATFFLSLVGLATNMSRVIGFESGEIVGWETRVRILAEGVSEGLHTVIAGFMLIALSAVLVAYASVRARRLEEG